jgi:hypothetical protein
MALTDPQAITIAPASALSLPRVGVGQYKSDYQSADGLVKLSLAHTYGRRTRRVMRVDHSKIAPDPFRPAENTKVSMSLYMVFDVPTIGAYTAAELLAIYTGFKTLYTASSDALVTKLLGGES